MKILQNKIFALAVCAAAIIVSGLIFVNKVLGTGGTVKMQSWLNMDGRMITNLPDLQIGDSGSRAANKAYVDKNILQSFTGSDPANPAVGQMWLRLDQ